MKGVFLLFGVCLILPLLAQGTWQRKADMGFERQKAVAFSVGSKGYVATGQIGFYTFLKDLLEFDPVANTWSSKANVPDPARTGAIGFSVGSKGYLGLGFEDNGAIRRDFYEYDPVSDTWTRKADFAGAGRRFAVAFSIGSKGYVVTGDEGSSLVSDMWEYDPASDSWAKKADFPGRGRKYAAGFVVNGKGYVGGGTGSSGVVRDFYEYDPIADSWTQKANFPGTRPEGTAAFGLGNFGYVGTGDNWSSFGEIFWQYNPATNSWIEIEDFPGAGREHAVGFTICGKGYIAAGGQDADFTFEDIWEYIPSGYDPAQGCCQKPTANFTASTTVACELNCLTFTDNSTNVVTSWQWTFEGAVPSSSTVQNPENICYTTPGVYDISLIVSTGECSDTIMRTDFITVVDSCNFVTASATDTCKGGCIHFSAVVPSGASDFQWWFPGATPSSSAVQSPTGICYSEGGAYSVELIYSIENIFDTIFLTDYITVADTVCPVLEESTCKNSVQIASAFSPNGDDKNEFIQPFFYQHQLSDYSLSIFNRWGQQVFYTTNPEDRWDGTFKGVKQDIQVFVYYVRFSCLGNDHLKTGNITLVR